MYSRTRATHVYGVPQCSCLCIRSRSAMHTPSECDGDRTHRSLGLETRPPSRTHTLRFFSGWGIIDPGADGRPFAGLAPAVLGVHASSHLVLTGGFTARALCTWDSSHCPRRCCRRAGRRYPKLVQCLYIRGSSHCPDTGHKKFFSPPSRPNLGQKRAITFLAALPCKSATMIRFLTRPGPAP